MAVAVVVLVTVTDTSRPAGLRSIAYLYVCLYVSKTTCQNFMKFSVLC